MIILSIKQPNALINNRLRQILEAREKRKVDNVPTVNLSSYIQGVGILLITKLTQAEYNSLTPDETTLYIIVG